MNLLLLLTAILTGLSGTMAAAQPVGRPMIEARQEAALAAAVHVARAAIARPWLTLMASPQPALQMVGSALALGDPRAMLRGERRLQ